MAAAPSIPPIGDYIPAGKTEDAAIHAGRLKIEGITNRRRHGANNQLSSVEYERRHRERLESV